MWIIFTKKRYTWDMYSSRKDFFPKQFIYLKDRKQEGWRETEGKVDLTSMGLFPKCPQQPSCSQEPGIQSESPLWGKRTPALETLSSAFPSTH